MLYKWNNNILIIDWLTFEVHIIHLAWAKPKLLLLRMVEETSKACIAGSGTCYNLDIEWRAAELLLSLPNKVKGNFLVNIMQQFSYNL